MRGFVFILLVFSITVCNAKFSYHLDIGVPRALELLKYEGSHSRIIGGTQVQSPTVIPHQAGIIARLTTGQQSVCGGSLISDSRVLTAAHCWRDGSSQASQFTVVLGSVTIFTGGTRIDTRDVVVHPKWNDVDITNDIMVVKITRVAFSNNIKAIPLATANNLNLAGLTGTISGFGKTSDSQSVSTTNLFHRTVSIISNADCQKALKNVKIEDSHVCSSGAGGVGTCDGDSGGPLTAEINKNRVLVGVVSFGLDEACSSGNPSVFTRVTAFAAWISANM